MISYRIAEEVDLTALQAFIDKYLRKDYFLPKAKLETIISRKCAYIALDNDAVVGFIYVDSGKRLFNLFVHPDYRKNGIGKALMDLTHPKSIRCKINMSSGDPTAFYRKLGYGICGEAIKGECKERGKDQKKTKQNSILILIKCASVPPITSFG
jgi:ribosomal protein S18 acetylase RimI-like enzyme